MAEYKQLLEQQQQQQQQQLERQRYLAEQQRRQQELQMQLGAQQQQQPQLNVNFDQVDGGLDFNSDLNKFRNYQQAPNVPQSAPKNPFDDNFSSGNAPPETDPVKQPSLNPFDSVFTDVSFPVTETKPKERSSSFKSHFRSRSDTFSDLAKRVEAGDKENDSENFLSVRETISPHKSSPDVRLEEGNTESYPVKSNGAETDVRNRGTGNNKTEDGIVKLPENSQAFLQKIASFPDSKTAEKMLIDLEKPVILRPDKRNDIAIRATNSEPLFSTQDGNGKVEKGRMSENDSKEEKPTLDEADEFPLISPSSSVPDRQYVYTRTSSCSSDEASDKSKDESSENDTDESKEESDYAKIRSPSLSSLEETVDHFELDPTENERASSENAAEDVFGSAPFTMGDSKKLAQKPASAPVKGSASKSSNHEKAPEISRSSSRTKSATGSFHPDPFNVASKGRYPDYKKELTVEESTLSRSPTSEDPFGHAPFIKIVKHKRPLSSQELAEKNKGHSNPRIHNRRRMLPKTPLNE